MNQSDFNLLFEKFTREHPMPPAEIDQLLNSLQDDEEKQKWLRSIGAVVDDMQFRGLSEPQVMKESFDRIITSSILGAPSPEEGGNTPIRRMFNWKKIAVAASVILAVGFGSYF